MQATWEVADVLRAVPDFGSVLNMGVHQSKTLRALQHCRTAALGGHVDACDACGVLKISYNSCRNRHCPKCQGHKRVEWIAQRQQDLLPVTYFHVVFTLPQELNPLTLHAPAIVYNALFKAAWKTLQYFTAAQLVQSGMIALLHTWGQNLSLHPHLHCIVPGGGVCGQGRFKKLKHEKNFLFSVRAMGKVFRAKYVEELRGAGITDQVLFDKLFQKDWVVYAKRPFGGPKNVIAYLGRYTHKVAISNHRIVEVTASEVTLTYKDYKDNGKQKTMCLSNAEFIRRFAQHILPHRFVRIRHYGILSSSWKRGRLRALQVQLQVKPKEKPVKTLLHSCPHCKTGTMITIELFGKRGPPPEYLTGVQSQTCQP